MVKWVDEKVLQKYWVENCHKYSVKGIKIKKSEFNTPFDAYPDVFCILENHERVPAEVEWKTSDFNHDVSVLKDAKGFLIVFEKNQNFELEQVILDRKDFEKWFKEKAGDILRESLNTIIREDEERKFPKLWMYYLNASANLHFYKEIKKRTWGVPKNFRQINRFRDIKRGDLMAFVGPWKPKGTGGRVPLNKFRGEIEKVLLFRISENYYYDETEVWEEGSSEKWPHRFKFDDNPIFELGKINISNLSSITKTTLHQLIYQLFWESSPFVIVDLISNSK